MCEQEGKFGAGLTKIQQSVRDLLFLKKKGPGPSTLSAQDEVRAASITHVESLVLGYSNVADCCGACGGEWQEDEDRSSSPMVAAEEAKSPSR